MLKVLQLANLLIRNRQSTESDCFTNPHDDLAILVMPDLVHFLLDAIRIPHMLAHGFRMTSN